MDSIPGTLTNPTVSVVMAVHDGEPYLRESVDSVLNQTFLNFEFLVFDDASTDRSLSILESYNDPRLKIIRNEKNIGLTNSLNLALSLARGRYIARMDSDDVCLPSRLEKQVAYLDANPGVALVGTWVEVINDSGEIFDVREPATDPGEIHEQLLVSNLMIHPTVMFRRDAVLAVGGYSTTAGRYAQDYDLWLRLSERYELANLPDRLLRYRFHPGQLTFKKLYGQTYAAEAYRSLAARRRQAQGESVPEDLVENRSTFQRWNRLRKLVAETYFHLAHIYYGSGTADLARRACARSLLYDPIQVVKRRAEVWDLVVPARQRRALNWYRHRLLAIISRSHSGP